MLAETSAQFPAPVAQLQNHMACPVIGETTESSMEYHHLMKGPDKDIWVREFANDMGHLEQGLRTRIPKGSNTIFFIHPSEIPTNKKVTYGRMVVYIITLKSESYIVRLTVGGDKLEFYGDASLVSASLATVKILLNSVVSTDNAKLTVAEINDFTTDPFFPNQNI